MRLDKNVQRFSSSWKEGFTIVICAYHKGPEIILIKKGDSLWTKKGLMDEEVDLRITFKSLESAFKVFTGQIGLDTAYAQNRMVIKGDIFKTMPLVNIVNICEYYLFPKFIWNKLMEKPNVTSNSLFIYSATLLGIK